MTGKVSKFVYWTPRVASILFICFLALFSLDVIEPGLSTSQIVIGLIMHNIPVFILLVLLFIAWKYEIVGAIAFILAGLLYSARTIFTVLSSDLPWYLGLSWTLTIAGPAFFIGILFLINWFKKERG